jgi:alkanesulfonate monooxygenase SsuD/methylene tetrahydromethanopterin reductase-like flavin-dependent oxidoreductase (luciferase family)
MVSVGMTLPSFVVDVEIPIRVARAADDAGLEGVFAYDHLFRVAADGTRRPAIECFALLGALAVETRRVLLGSLVARATLRPPAVLAQNFATLQRTSDGRAIAAIGAGDGESRAENEEFGLGFGLIDDRIDALRAAVEACRGNGYPVWVGGTARPVLELAASADAWNRWGGSVESFREQSGAVRAIAAETGLTWGGLVVLAETDEQARSKAARLGAGASVVVGSPATVARSLRGYVDAGAAWIILGPIDSTDPANAPLAAAVREHLAKPA